MKDKFKKGLLALMIAPTMFFATACGDDPEDPPSAEEQAYTTLRTIVNEKKVPTSTTKLATETDFVNMMTMSFDFTASGMDEATVNAMKEYMPSGSEGSKGKRYYGYSSDNTGYMLDTRYNEETEEYETDELKFVKKSGNDYILYKNSGGEYKLASKVDDKYAPNTFKMGAEEIFSEDGELSQISGVLETVSENDSYEKFKEATDELAIEMLDEFMEMGGDLTVDDISIAVSLKTENNVNKLVATITIDDYSMVMEGVAASADITAVAEVRFDNEKMIGYTVDMDLDATSTMKSSSITGDTTTYDDNDVITMTMSMDMGQDVVLGTTYDDTIIPADVTDYDGTGTGVDGAIENRRDIYVKIDFVDLYEEDDTYRYRSFTMGDVLAIEQSNATVELYWDEACTDKLDSTDKCPSYDGLKLYAKITPDEGYAITIESRNYQDQNYVSESSYFYVVPVAQGYSYGYLNDSSYNLEKITVNGVEVAEANYEAGLTLESGKIYKVQYTLTDKEIEA